MAWGGIGKTQIAIEYAHCYRHDYQTILWTRADTREALISGTDALSQLSSRQQSVTFDDVAFAMNPLRFNGMKPRTLFGQKEGQDTNPFARLLDLRVMFANPGPHQLAVVPASIIPDQEPVAFPLLLQTLTAPIEKLKSYGAHGSSCDKTQPHLIPLRFVRNAFEPSHSIACQRFGVRITFLPRLLYQADWMVLLLPSRKTRPSKSTPPDLIEEADGPIRTRAGIIDQPITSRFFWRSIGSGLVIQCVARFQLIPMRLKARRTLSSEISSQVSPTSKQTRATSSNDQMSHGLPNSRGLRCNTKLRVHFDAIEHLVVPARGLIEPAEILVRMAIVLKRETLPPQEQRGPNTGEAQDRPTLRVGPLFYDPGSQSAGQLIERVGLAGFTLGNVQIAPQDANTLLNLSGAQASDALTLLELIHQRVLEQLGIDLALALDVYGESLEAQACSTILAEQSRLLGH